MAPPIDHKALWALVRLQFQVISRPQLMQFGITAEAIKHRIRRGRLTVVWPGVYQVGRAPLTREGRFMAAVLACGDGAALSHGSAAELWGIRKRSSGLIHISVPHTRRIRLKGIRPHRRNPMPRTTTSGPLPLVEPLSTLIDLAAELQTDALEAALNEADKLGLIHFDRLEDSLADAPLHPGIGRLRSALGRYTRTDSNLERRFLALLRKHRLPLPTTQQHVGRGRVDFYWDAHGLVIETDGLTYHRTPIQQLEDRRRDQEHAAAGRTHVRVANLQIREQPAEVAQLVRRLLRRLEPPAAA